MTAIDSQPCERRASPGSGWAAEVTFHVRYAETDQMGIVHHSAYVPWLEEARSALSRQYGRSYANRCSDALSHCRRSRRRRSALSSRANALHSIASTCVTREHVFPVVKALRHGRGRRSC
jgi:hypothetical protein